MLKPMLDNLEGLDATTAALYIEKDGKYRLDVEGGFKTNEEINGLTSALNKERDARSKLEKQLKKFDGIEDPAEALKAIETLKNLDQKKLIDAGEVEKVKAEVTKAMQSKIDELQNIVQEKDSVLTKELIGGRFARSKFINEKMAIPHDLVEARFGQNFKIEEGQVVAYDQHGNKVYSQDRPGELAEFDEALNILVSQYPYKDSILKGSDAFGSGAPPNGTRPGSTNWHDLPPIERLSFARRAGIK
jgi:beta-galactosidase/beta-glucuronidase